MTIEKAKVWFETMQAFAAIAAIGAGLWWFFQQRSTKPQVKLEQSVTQRPVAGQDGETLITVDVRATNVGKVKVDLKPGQLDLRQLNPPGNSALLTTFALAALRLEPGESAQARLVTVIVRNSIRTLQIHSDYPVPGAHEYWNLLSVVDIAPVGKASRRVRRKRSGMAPAGCSVK